MRHNGGSGSGGGCTRQGQGRQNGKVAAKGGRRCGRSNNNWVGGDGAGKVKRTAKNTMYVLVTDNVTITVINNNKWHNNHDTTTHTIRTAYNNNSSTQY